MFCTAAGASSRYEPGRNKSRGRDLHGGSDRNVHDAYGFEVDGGPSATPTRSQRLLDEWRNRRPRGAGARTHRLDQNELQTMRGRLMADSIAALGILLDE